MHSVELDAEVLRAADVVVVVTDHTEVDYGAVARDAALVVDTRGVMRGHLGGATVVGLSGESAARGGVRQQLAAV
jgi:UDP-N-acetyl-D-glucosamine dehydrogenase